MTGLIDMKARRAVCLAAGLVVLLGGCSAFPTQGPYPQAVAGGKFEDPDKVQYVLADLTPSMLVALKDTAPKAGIRGTIGDRRPAPELLLGVGDIVSVTIFEAAAGGLFIPQEAGSRAGNFVTLPNQEIDKAGVISVPYADLVRAAGRTLSQVKFDIEQRLRNRAIDPQAVVTLVDGRSSQVSVTGEVNTSVRYTLSKSGERLLDAVARAGGPRYPAFETYVTLRRGSRTAKAYLNQIIESPDENVYLYPGDTVVLNREFRSFMALGASGQNGQINFDNETLSLSQALGKAGGILDSRGDPAESYVYRLEYKKAVAQMGYDTTPYLTPMVPVIYRVNLREPDGFFLAGKFMMRDGDVLFVSNAPIAEITKLLSLLQLGANSVSDVNVARVAIRGGRQ